jgi:hypothetical protein
MYFAEANVEACRNIEMNQNHVQECLASLKGTNQILKYQKYFTEGPEWIHLTWWEAYSIKKGNHQIHSTPTYTPQLFALNIPS